MNPFTWIKTASGNVAIPPASLTSQDSAIPASLTPPPTQAAPNVQPQTIFVADLSRFGDAILNTVVFAGAGNQLVLLRPTQGIRRFLFIGNNLAAGIARINLDAPANVGLGIGVGAGLALFMDAFVFQNDIHVFLPGAGNITLCYSNVIPV